MVDVVVDIFSRSSSTSSSSSRAMTVLGRDRKVGDAARAALSAAEAMAEGGAGTMAAWRYHTAATAASIMALHATDAWQDATSACTATMVCIHGTHTRAVVDDLQFTGAC